jgi:2-polyprenyl-3-methyl-5-hydroxy-6-metoxy-1,4-benzoquinol methylase
MVCCTGYCAAEAQFNYKVAERDLRRYRRRGADATTRLMLAELRRWPLEGRRLLDVGGGIGVISRELAGTGVASATIVEASPAYLEVARREAGSQYGSRPTQFILGDFAVIASTLPDADVVTHGPERMEAVLETAGLVRATRRETLVWTFDLYRRGRDV